ncbi:MAG: gamma-glutamylcyclotransferase family protein [Mariprofundaceae bacterium]|nr:gamma-glutamylcyclotransferase family protein [Mariprofundaceae bacterium]
MNDLFVYGSLLNIDSAKPIFHSISPSDYQPYILNHYSLEFNVNVPVYTSEWCGAASFLNVQYSAKSQVLGMILQVSDQQILDLKKREKYYNLVTITAADGKTIKTFSLPFCKKNDIQPYHPILEQYIAKIKRGIDGFEDHFSNTYLIQLEKAQRHRALIYGQYTFQDNEINKMTDHHYD